MLIFVQIVFIDSQVDCFIITEHDAELKIIQDKNWMRGERAEKDLMNCDGTTLLKDNYIYRCCQLENIYSRFFAFNTVSRFTWSWAVIINISTSINVNVRRDYTSVILVFKAKIVRMKLRQPCDLLAARSAAVPSRIRVRSTSVSIHVEELQNVDHGKHFSSMYSSKNINKR